MSLAQKFMAVFEDQALPMGKQPSEMYVRMVRQMQEVLSLRSL